MKNVLVKLLIVVCCCPVVTAQRREGNFLDLTQDIPPQRQRTYGYGGVAGSTHGPRVEIIPVKVVLVSLDRRNYRMGQRVVYEFEIENTLKTDLLFPWSLDLDRVQPDEKNDPPGYVKGYLSLTVENPTMRREFISGAGVYGSSLAPESLRRLSPGERVRIRASGLFAFGQESTWNRVREQLPANVEVRAYFWLREGSFDSKNKPAVSENSIRVELTK